MNTAVIDEEATIWRGRPSQWVNFPSLCFYFVMSMALFYGQNYLNHSNYGVELTQYLEYVNGGVYLIFLYFVLRILVKVLQVYSTHYELTDERLIESKGITGFFRSEEPLELYNIYDYQFPAPLFLALCRRGSLRLLTHDATQPIVELCAIRERKKVYEKIRLRVEDLRMKKKGYFNDPAA